MGLEYYERRTWFFMTIDDALHRFEVSLECRCISTSWERGGNTITTFLTNDKTCFRSTIQHRLLGRLFWKHEISYIENPLKNAKEEGRLRMNMEATLVWFKMRRLSMMTINEDLDHLMKAWRVHSRATLQWSDDTTRVHTREMNTRRKAFWMMCAYELCELSELLLWWA